MNFQIVSRFRLSLFPLLSFGLFSSSLFCACASSNQTDGQEKLSISVGYWNIDRMSDVSKDAVAEYVENRFSISITPVSVDWTNYKDYYRMLSATDSLPDVFADLTISSNDANDSAFYEELIADGAIRPLPDDLSAWPNLKRLMETMEYTRYTDGHFYAIPRASFLDSSLSCTDAAMIVRRDWMDALGISDPENLEDFIRMITAFAKDDPDGNGLDDTIGYNVNALSALGKWVILGIAPECNVYSWIEQDGSYIPSWYTEEFRDVVSAYRTMYESGGLDPDFYIKNPTEVLTDFASGKLGALEYKSSPSSLQQLEQLWKEYNDQSFEDCVDVLPIFAASDGVRYCNSSSLFWSESYISSSVDDQTLERILDLYDFMLSDEGLFLGKYGLEGVDYTLDEDGNYTCLLDTSSQSLSDILEEKYPSIVLFSGLATWGGTDADFELNEMNTIRYGKHCIYLAHKDVTWNRENAVSVVRPESFMICPKEASELFSTSNVLNELILCIIGTDDPLKMWDEVIENFRENGLDDYIRRQNETYSRSGI